MSKKLTYSEAGVDRETRAKSKEALSMLKQTYSWANMVKLSSCPTATSFLPGPLP